MTTARMLMAMACALFITAAAQAGSITSLVGDKDGFGGVTVDPVPADGTVIYMGGFDNRDVSDPDFTDVWTGSGEEGNSITYFHTYALSGTATSALLTIQEAGMSDGRGPWDVYFNGVAVGVIDDLGYGVESVLREFVIDPTLLTGNDVVDLIYQTPTFGDGFALNFLELSIETLDDGGGSSEVPEPTTAALGALAMAGLLARRRQRDRA